MQPQEPLGSGHRCVGLGRLQCGRASSSGWHQVRFHLPEMVVAMPLFFLLIYSLTHAIVVTVQSDFLELGRHGQRKGLIVTESKNECVAHDASRYDNVC
jgi:hypothetical protein